jgi:periplasmic divalent cation tolerance protein
MIVIVTTLHKKEMAQKIGRGLLEKRLIACYNLCPIESAYWWKGDILAEDEILVIMKTTEDKFVDIEQYFMKSSGYEVPELIALKPHQVNELYKKWVNKEVNKHEEKNKQ